MNNCLILAHNCLGLTKRCVDSIRNQDIPVEITLIDNASTDGTADWFNSTDDLDGFIWAENRGVSAGWNWGLHVIFAENKEANHVLVVNNDTVLPPWMYRSLLAYDAPFVTGVSYEDMDAVMTPRDEPSPLTPGPDFSCFLIRRDAWEQIGPFDERMKHYASDLDYHIRAHRAGIFLGNSHVKFFHLRSSTLKMASPEDQREIQRQADSDRQTFFYKYGCHPGSKQYNDLFLPQPVESE